MSEATTVLRVGEMDLSLVSQCMEFYKHLTNKGPAFKFSFSLSTVFNFSMDFSQADKLTPSGKPNRKKQSPGTLKINAYRSQIFLEKKAKENQVRNCLFPFSKDCRYVLQPARSARCSRAICFSRLLISSLSSDSLCDNVSLSKEFEVKFLKCSLITFLTSFGRPRRIS